MTNPEILPSLTDEELVKLAKKRRQRAFRELKQRYERRVFGLIFDMVENPTEAEDLTAETFAKAFLAIKTCTGSFRAWLFAIARNAARDRLKHSTIEKVPIQTDDMARTSEIIASNAVQIMDTSAAPIDPVLLEELKAVVAKAMAELRPEHRQAILMCTVEGLSHKDAASVLDESPSTVATWIDRGWQQIQKAIREHLAG